MQGAVDNSKTKYPKGSHHKNMVWKIRRGSRDNASNSSAAAKVYLKGSDAGSHSSRTSSGRSQSDQRYQSTTKSGESGGRSVNSSSRQSEGSDHHSATTGSSGSSVHVSKSSAGGRRSLQHSVDNRTPIRSPAEKSVQFKEIYIRDYERIVGDNPSCSSGPPIG